MLPPVAPVVSIYEDGGGLLDDFGRRVSEYEVAGTKVRILGFCASACTMVAALPPDRICVGPDAELAFHQPFTPIPGMTLEESVTNRSESGVRFISHFYPRRVRDWINKHGGLTARLITLRGRALRGLFRSCAG